MAVFSIFSAALSATAKQGQPRELVAQPRSEVEVRPEPVFAPPALIPDRERLDERLEAVVNVTVSPEGRVASAMLVRATTKAFGDAALAAARRWQFSPGSRFGRPHRFDLVLLFDTGPVEGSRQTDMDRVITEQVFAAEELDERVRVRESSMRGDHWPRYPREFRGSGKSAFVTFQIVVDPAGRPLNPKVVNATDKNFIAHALRALSELRFEPGRIGGMSVYSYYELTLPFVEPHAPPRDIASERWPLRTPDQDAGERVYPSGTRDPRDPRNQGIISGR